MKKVAKAILLALGVIFVLGAVIVLGVNVYVQSAGTHARIERGLSMGLHTPLKIGSLSFMPWYGLKLSGITRDYAAAPADDNSLNMSDITVRLQLWKLMKHEVVIKELSVDGVRVAWIQNPDGKWEMPAGSAFSTVELPPQTGPRAEQPPAAPQPTTAETPLAPPPAPSEKRPVTIRHARMRDASFSFYNKNHKPIAAFTGIYVQTPSPTDKLVLGTAKVSKVAIQNEFYLEDWKGTFKYTPEELSLFDTSCKVDGGTATGTLDVKIAEADSPFSLDTHFSGVDLDRLLTDAGVTQVQASGTLSGFLHLEGDLRNSLQAQGKGQIVLSNGFITDSDLFESLGASLRTDKFRKLNLDDAHANFHVGGGAVFLDDLALKSSALTLTAQGAMATDGTHLFLNSRLAISADIARQIPDFLLLNFQKDETSGARYVDFPVTGDLGHPKTDLLKIVKQHMSFKTIWKNFIDGQQPQSPPPATPGPDQAQPAAPNP